MRRLLVVMMLALACSRGPGPDGQPVGRAGVEPSRHALEWGQAQVWRVPGLQRDDVLHVSVVQDGVDVKVSVWDPRGHRVHLEDRITARTGTEQIWVKVERSGDYRVQVAPVTHPEAEGAYAIRAARDTGDDAQARAEVCALEQDIRESLDTAGEALADAHTQAREAARRWETLDRGLRRAYVLLDLGRSDDLSGDYAAGRRNLEAALEAFEELDHVPGLARAHYGLGNNIFELGDLAVAERHFETAARLAREVGDVRTAGRSVHNVGSIHLVLGEPNEALESFRQGLEDMEQSDRTDLPTAYAAIGETWQAMGNAEVALEQYQHALEVLEEQNLRWDTGRLLTTMGFLHVELTGRADEALESFEAARKIATDVGDTANLADIANGMGRARLALGDAQAACASHTEARRRYHELEAPLGIAEAELGLAACSRAQGELEAAGTHVREAARRAESFGSGQLQAMARAEQAKIERRAGDLAAAEASMQGAITVMEDLRSRIAHPQQRATFFGTVRPYYDALLEIQIARGELGEAFRTSERARARGLLEVLGLRDVPEKEAARLAEAERELKSAQFAYVQALTGGDEQQIPAAKQRVERAAQIHTEREATARRASSTRVALARDSDVDAAALVSALPADTVLVEYALTDAGGHAFVLTHDQGLRHVSLPPQDEIESWVRELVEALTARNRRGADAESGDARAASLARKLSSALVEPLGLPGEARRLWIVPDGALHYLPFALLPAGKSSLSERFELARLPAAAYTAGARVHGKRVAVIADPVYSAADSRLSEPVAEADRPFPRLRFSRQEADVIGELAGKRADVATDFDASTDWLRTHDLSDYRVIHLATHGTLDSTRPELSSLVLSLVDENGETTDGFLRLHDIYRMHLDAQLVVLSACETAVGKRIRGEGVLGLTRGFLQAGSDGVIASLWPVNDRATAELMKAFYAQLLEHDASPASALAAAQSSLRNSERWSAPYYWSAFTLQERRPAR